jgi:hypothetical protein
MFVVAKVVIVLLAVLLLPVEVVVEIERTINLCLLPPACDRRAAFIPEVTEKK